MYKRQGMSFRKLGAMIAFYSMAGLGGLIITVSYTHLPETGYPVWNGLTAVTVVCDSGIMADGLSTACFVLGKEKALPLLEKYGADALFADENHKVYLTEGMEERFELMKDTYKAVSYTHLDVYKRQDVSSPIIIGMFCVYFRISLFLSHT